jgi:hypothetical protein
MKRHTSPSSPRPAKRRTAEAWVDKAFCGHCTFRVVCKRGDGCLSRDDFVKAVRIILKSERKGGEK